MVFTEFFARVAAAGEHRRRRRCAAAERNLCRPLTREPLTQARGDPRSTTSLPLPPAAAPAAAKSGACRSSRTATPGRSASGRRRRRKYLLRRLRAVRLAALPAARNLADLLRRDGFLSDALLLGQCHVNPSRKDVRIHAQRSRRTAFPGSRAGRNGPAIDQGNVCAENLPITCRQPADCPLVIMNYWL